jgi:hypothetical protein
MELRPEIKMLLQNKQYTRFINLTKDVPRIKGECAWCGKPAHNRLKYCSKECSKDAYIRASGAEAVRQVFRRYKGVCAVCGMDCVWLRGMFLSIVREYKYDRNLYQAWGIWQTSNSVFWEAHHIVPISAGGGVCGLDNYQTLCLKCHKAVHSGG